jgi:hypothetical protein
MVEINRSYGASTNSSAVVVKTVWFKADRKTDGVVEPLEDMAPCISIE